MVYCKLLEKALRRGTIQYIIPELSKFMPFDFAIFKNGKLVCLIEFDGEQHYRPIGGEDKFKI